MSFPPYSVLMSLYAKERPEWLTESLDSILAQTVSPAEIVIVKDGPLTSELESVLEDYSRSNSGMFNFVGYGENRGLGWALREGVCVCSNEIVARMDTDDIARADRMEKQLAAIEGGLDMIGSQVIEFVDSPEQPVACTTLPEGQDAITAYSKRRNPFRHPSITYRRSKVLEAGNYNPQYLYFEDWDLFNRMLAIGCRADNLVEPLVGMRVSEDFYARRGGIDYLRHVWKFKSGQLRSGWLSPVDFAASFMPHAVVCLIPNSIRSLIYRYLLRRS